MADLHWEHTQYPKSNESVSLGNKEIFLSSVDLMRNWGKDIGGARLPWCYGTTRRPVGQTTELILRGQFTHVTTLPQEQWLTFLFTSESDSGWRFNNHSSKQWNPRNPAKSRHASTTPDGGKWEFSWRGSVYSWKAPAWGYCIALYSGSWAPNHKVEYSEFFRSTNVPETTGVRKQVELEKSHQMPKNEKKTCGIAEQM